MKLKMRMNQHTIGKARGGNGFTRRTRGGLLLALCVVGAGFVPNTARAQSWTFDITNGNGSGTDGSRIFNLNALLNAGQPFTAGSIMNGLTVTVNAAVTNTGTGSNPGESLFYIGSVGPVFYAGNNPVSNFTLNGAFLNDPGLFPGATDSFSLGSFDASAWLNTLNPGGNAPVVFTGSFLYTLSADIEDLGGNTVANLPDITPGAPTGPTVQFEATISAPITNTPEPGSIALLFALGTAGAVFVKRRRK